MYIPQKQVFSSIIGSEIPLLRTQFRDSEIQQNIHDIMLIESQVWLQKAPTESHLFMSRGFFCVVDRSKPSQWQAVFCIEEAYN